MYAVRMTPVEHPSDSISIEGFDTPRDAWNELLTQLERDQDALPLKLEMSHSEYVAQYQTAIDAILDTNLDLPGVVKVGSEFVYGVIESAAAVPYQPIPENVQGYPQEALKKFFG
jgi:hypothetical protein